ncbi:MAG: hypothetical protein FIB08_07560 [Candidatus Methanoperedens sp.]|nr:hypothetical protein [Candidatus Methanoperedens sp.]
MGISDKLKNMGKSTKDQAVLSALSPAMQLIDRWTKDIKPENDISRFIDEKYGILFEAQSSEANGMMALLTKLAIAEANTNPEWVENKLLRFYDEFRVWYKEYLARKDMQNGPT